MKSGCMGLRENGLEMNMAKVMILEDDEILAAGLGYNLQKRGVEPFPVHTVEEAKKLLDKMSFDLVLLDVNLPDGNGFLFARDVMAHSDTPFLFLTAHRLDEEILEGYHLGADDYITKPFSVQIVMEKILAILRRCGGQKEKAFYACGNLTVDFDNRVVRKSGEVCALTPTEYDILSFLVKNRGRILTKEILLQNIWDSRGNYVNAHTLALNVSRLRNKIADSAFGYIKTIYGMGYKWIGDGLE